MDEYKLGDSSTTALGSLNEARQHHGCAISTNLGVTRVVVAGGDENGVRRTSVEVMTRSSPGSWSSWTVVDHLPSGRNQFSMVYSSGMIYILGGSTAAGIEDSVLKSEDGTGWQEDAAKLNLGRAYHTAVNTKNLC